MKTFVKIEKNDRLTISLKVKPNAKEDKIFFFEEIDGVFYLRISVKSPPEDGKANKAIIDLISKKMKIRKQNLEIIRGAVSQYKVLEIKNITIVSLNEIFSTYINYDH